MAAPDPLAQALQDLTLTAPDPPESPIDAFFAQYPTYNFNRAAHIQLEFRRLAAAQGWIGTGTSTDVNRTKRFEFCTALAREYQLAFVGCTELEALVMQCGELGASEEEKEGLRSRTQCKKFLDTKYVNIFDVLNGRRHQATVRMFDSYHALARYTTARGKCRMFPKEIVKDSGGSMVAMLFKFF